jgi:bifunctional non-homologous end joining protein LigD
LQNGSLGSPIFYYIFDLLVLSGRDVMNLPLNARRDLLEREFCRVYPTPNRCSPELNAKLSDLIQSVKVQGLERLVAKGRDSRAVAR